MNKFMVKKEFRESMFDSKGLWMIAGVSVIMSALCILVLNVKEGSVLAQTDILGYSIKCVVFLTLTVSMVLGASSMIAEREQHTLESLLLTPVPKQSIARAKYISTFLTGMILYAVSIPYLAAIGYGSGLGFYAILITIFGGAILLFAFAAIAMALSIVMQSSKVSVLVGVLIMVALTLPAIIQGLFKMSPAGNFILKIDPVACLFNMADTVLKDHTPVMSLWKYIIPMLVFAALGAVILNTAGKKISLRGE